MYAVTVFDKAPSETVVDRPRSTEEKDKNQVQDCVKHPNKTNVIAKAQTNHDCSDSNNKSSDGIDTSTEQDNTVTEPYDHVKSSSTVPGETDEPSANIKRQSDKIQEIKLSADEGTKDKASVIRKSSTTTLSKFKEKRPEPLKLNPNLNQDIPLDLSVKSAGNVPPGTLSNIFNLVPMSHMTTLETPRIQWQDNDALLALEKARSFSSSTNASHRARMSSLMGESPPMTPNTPLMDIMFASSRVNSRSSKQPHSASMILESSSLNESTFESRKSQILDRWAHSIKPSIDQSKNHLKVGPRRSCSTDNLSFNASGVIQQAKVDKFIRLKVKQDDITHKTTGYNSKKNSISPLAIKSFSNNTNSSSYPNQQIAMDLNDTQQSPTVNSAINNKSLTPTSVANATANLLNIHLNSPTGNSHSPVTSMFEVGNLNQQSQLPQYISTNFTSFDHEASSLDPLISAAFCQQHHQNSRAINTSINHSSPSLTGDHNNNYQHSMMQHHAISSISSSNTLNTPTLISPSQLRAGHLCFQPSPTLSPMSSVFELPSPFLTFPPCSHNPTASSSEGSKQNSPQTFMSGTDANVEAKKSKNPRGLEESNSDSHLGGMIVDANEIKSYDALRANSDDRLNKTTRACLEKSSLSNNNISSTNDLSHLITSASCKILQSPQTTVQSTHQNTADDNIEMDTDCDSVRAETTDQDFSQEPELGDMSVRPVSVIPQILISDHQLNRQINSHIRNHPSSNKKFGSQGLSSRQGDNLDTNVSGDQRSQRNSSSKRSLSPKSFRVQVNNYRNERFESSSAPPDVNQRHARAKIKTVTTDSCFEIMHKNSQSRCEPNKASLEPYLHSQASNTNCNASRSQPSIIQRNNRTSKLRQDIHEWYPSSSQMVQKSGQIYMASCSTTLENRSSSAEPAIFPRFEPDEVRQCMSSASNLENTLNCCQSTAQIFQANSLSHSAHQLHYTTELETPMSQDTNSMYQPALVKNNRQNNNMYEPNHQLPPHHHNTKYHYYPQQSISAGELYKTTHFPSDGRSIVTTNNVGNLPIQDSNQFLQQQPPTQHLFRASHQFNQPAISSSLDRVDNLSNSYQNMQADQKNQQMAGIMQTNNQISVINLLCSNGPRHMTNQHKSAPIQLKHPMESLTNTKLSIGPYQIDSESRSDSRSSCSLDFTNAFLGGGSRPNSAASSNLASKKYHCDQCSKSFTRSDMLTRHRRLHSGDRPFQCTECKQEFSRSDHLSTHMRTHTGEKPYKCKMCSYSACRKDMITRHLKVHSRGPHSVDCL